MVPSWIMGSKVHVCLLIISIQVLLVAAETNNLDYTALTSLKDVWKNTPPNWVGLDPCGGWVGIRCNKSRVTAITLSNMNLSGVLSGDIQSLSELQILDLSYNKGLTEPLPQSIGNLTKLSNLILTGCSFTGPIPDTIGSLQQLYYLSLNSNGFSGNIPPTIGKLSKLYWLDLSDNKFFGTIPISSGTMPGLDMLVNTKHFHFSKNQLSGEIPSQLFNSKLAVIHVLFDSNNFSGSIPSTLGLLQNLEILRLDRNKLTGPVPSKLNDLVHVSELFLSNNQLTGPLPNLSGMNVLNYVDFSNNTFEVSDFPPWLSTLQSLTTLMMENAGLQGPIPVELFRLPLLQTIVLRYNHLNGTLDLGSSSSDKLQLVDLQSNLIVGIADETRFHVDGAGFNFSLLLAGNPICEETGGTKTYCSNQQSMSSNSMPSYSTPTKNCTPATCSSDKISSPLCMCAYPYIGTLYFRAPSFSDLGNSNVYMSIGTSLMRYFESHQFPVDSVSLSNATRTADDYVELRLKIFPRDHDRFNRTAIYAIGFAFSNQTFKPNKTFGPFSFNGEPYGDFAEGSTGTNKSSSTGITIGAAVGGSALVIFCLLAGIYAFRQKRRAKKADKQNNPFASWDPNKSSGDIPRLKGPRSFSFEELKKYTNNFAEDNYVGSGGYGKVYRGTLPNGQLIAVKRAQHGSMQGGMEFKTEIELLSRVHHKNVVSLVGFCFEQGEQMLVYEYIPNGTLKESLSGKSGIRLDWMRRLRIALGAARGLQYLHELANPPIIHRDIKSNNILLDDRLTAKVSDFGLCKLIGDVEKGHITTQVKGTMGYMDPEYYMTQQLTEKSDVYSFGVVMLELVSGKQPIERGKYIVREVKQLMDKSKVLYNLPEILDLTILDTTLRGLEKFVDLALRCVEEAAVERPTMGEVVKEIEGIMQIIGLNPNADSTSTSTSYEGSNKDYNHPYSDDSLIIYSGTFPPSKLDPH